MKIHLLFLSLLILSCSPENANQISFSDAPDEVLIDSIYGGSPLDAHNNPGNGLVMLYDKSNNRICSAVIIQQKTLLTASHCIDGLKENYSVAFGVEPLNGNYFSRKIKHWKKHHELDVALIVLDQTIPPGWRPLPLLARAPRVSEKVLVAGYGRSEKSNGGKLLAASVSVIDFQQNKLIIIDQSKGSGICYGDSGGPLLIKGDKGLLIAGIAASVRNLASGQESQKCRYQSVFSATYPLSGWIYSTSNQLMAD